jgi:hypothetical protein
VGTPGKNRRKKQRADGYVFCEGNKGVVRRGLCTLAAHNS